jgi:hypothetical protein
MKWLLCYFESANRTDDWKRFMSVVIVHKADSLLLTILCMVHMNGITTVRHYTSFIPIVVNLLDFVKF